MRHHNSLFHGLLKPIRWDRFEGSVEKHEADKGTRELTTKSQLIALLQVQLAGLSSLREVVVTMESHRARLYHLGAEPPKRTTLADANRDRPVEVFTELFQTLLAQAHPGLRRNTREAIRLIDSTSIQLSGLSEKWASYQSHDAGVKAHIVYDPDAEVPVYFTITPQRESDIRTAKTFPVETGATYVFDLGYYDFAWWRKLLDNDCRFVTRLKTNSPTKVITERVLGADVVARGRVTKDRTVQLTSRLKGTRTHPLGGRDLREVHVILDTGRPLRIVSNDQTSTAEEIADLYKQRWGIELFFRWAKQTLKIKKFLGTSENAVKIQLTVALIAYLLLRIAHSSQTVVHNLLAFAQLVRANLMHPKMIHNLTSTVPPPLITTGQLNLELSYG
jgi:Transposase DDE domain/Domain of unknown function (DUF4372)